MGRTKSRRGSRWVGDCRQKGEWVGKTCRNRKESGWKELSADGKANGKDYTVSGRESGWDEL
jgi:hypothetical protein